VEEEVSVGLGGGIDDFGGLDVAIIVVAVVVIYHGDCHISKGGY